SKNSRTAASSNDGEIDTPTTTDAPASASASPSPVTVSTRVRGDATTASCPSPWSLTPTVPATRPASPTPTTPLARPPPFPGPAVDAGAPRRLHRLVPVPVEPRHDLPADQPGAADDHDPHLTPPCVAQAFTPSHPRPVSPPATEAAKSSQNPGRRRFTPGGPRPRPGRRRTPETSLFASVNCDVSRNVVVLVFAILCYYGLPPYC